MVTNRTIHYINLDTLGSVLTKQSDLTNENFVYTKCPVFNHKQNRVFVGLSPIDYSLRINRVNGKNHIICDNPDLLTFDDEHTSSPQPVVQLKIPKFFFWTNDDNVWIEMNDHPMTSHTNNFIAVSGWWNLSNWSRSISLGMTIVDETNPVVIKKGDPLFRISFYSNDMDDTFTLKEEKDIQKINQIKNIDNLKTNDSWRSRLFSKTGINKCPVGFLFKN